MGRPLVIGVHHKTGTLLAQEVTHLLAAYLSSGQTGSTGSIVRIPNSSRKLPLSEVLKRIPRASVVYNIWFEHEVDVPGIKFLHFVRDPFTRIASAYLYHKRGAPSDQARWVEWPIFDFNGPKSYVELLNELNTNDGLLLEAIRTYPEAMGSARAFESALRLSPNDSLPIWLHEFESNPMNALTEIFRFTFGERDNRIDEFLLGANSNKVILGEEPNEERRAHVTRNDIARPAIEKAIEGSLVIASLYEVIVRKMGTTERPVHVRPVEGGAGQQRETSAIAHAGRSGWTTEIINEIQIVTPWLMTSPEVLQRNRRFWKDVGAGSIWQSFPLSNFAVGHLMMYPFIQKVLSRLT